MHGGGITHLSAQSHCRLGGIPAPVCNTCNKLHQAFFLWIRLSNWNELTFWWKGKKTVNSRPLGEQSTSIGIPPLKRGQGNVANQSGNTFITITLTLTHYSWMTGYCGRNRCNFQSIDWEVEVSLTGSTPLALMNWLISSETWGKPARDVLYIKQQHYWFPFGIRFQFEIHVGLQ